MESSAVSVVGAIDDSWERYVASHPAATAYHGCAWQRAVDRTFGKQRYYLVARSGSGAVCGVLPLVRIRSLLFGDNLVSEPYCNYGGALADDDATYSRIYGRAIELGRSLDCDTVQLREHLAKPTGDDWQQRTDKVRMLLRLPHDPDELARRLGAKRRSQIKRSQREHPEVRVGGAELVKPFYEVFCANMRDLGTPVYPRSFFDNIVYELGDACRVIIIELDSRPVAAAFLLSYRHTLEIPWASALRSYSRIAVNMLLYWEALRYAIENEFRVFDFGRCTRGEGTYRFKKQWGCDEHPLHWKTRTLRNEVDTTGQGAGRGAELMRRLWTRLPLAIANRLGPRITSNLPW